MKGRFIIIIILFFSLSWFCSCKKNKYRINVSSVEADIKIKRLENDLFRIDPAAINDSLPALKKKYGDFLQYFSYVIKAGDINDTLFGNILVSFCTDKLNNEVYSAVSQLYPDVSLIEKSLGNAFRHYLWYFPDKTIPGVFTCTTGFNRSIITSDSVLGISLDRYLGRDCKYYPGLEIYGYLSARMNPVNIVPDCMYAWGSKLWYFEDMNYQADNVLSEMIHEGKLRYFEKCMIPDINDTLLFGFTRGQMKVCKNNEGQMWTYLIENNLLFSSDKFIIRKLTGEAPFTSYYTNESPGKAAVWQGFKIIEAYMSGNRDVSLEDMMRNTDVQDILDKAKYNP
ncbi:MAG: hypothetical protein NT092_06430 [Bacteroidia bacterium]|nr:hypothetical protein [Bacteroidia bacterium]